MLAVHSNPLHVQILFGLLYISLGNFGLRKQHRKMLVLWLLLLLWVIKPFLSLTQVSYIFHQCLLNYPRLTCWLASWVKIQTLHSSWQKETSFYLASNSLTHISPISCKTWLRILLSLATSVLWKYSKRSCLTYFKKCIMSEDK